MRFTFIILVGATILAIGLAGGFYLALLLQKQVEILIGAAILFAFLTWLGSGVELLGLLRDIYRQKTEEERHTKEVILERIEPFFKALRPHLVRALAAHAREDIASPTSSDNYVISLEAFRVKMRNANADGTLRTVQSKRSLD